MREVENKVEKSNALNVHSHNLHHTMSPSWKIVLGADEAGHGYKSIIKADLEKDPRVTSIIDVGVHEGTDKTAYPHVGVAAARKVASGEADRALLICGTGESHRGRRSSSTI